MGIVESIALAFLGGMLLNLMPCVLPVLAVKVTALASMGDHSRGERLRHGFGYAAGIVVSMLVLAGVIIGLKMAGEVVGWGFQFQQPLFVVALAAVMVLFSLNLFGVYEFGIPRAAAQLGAPSQHQDQRSFFEGILAVVLATPCTAPFMGTAIGFAMTSHPLIIVSVFVSLGLGLAAPFVAVALVPGFYRLIPRPGPWMGTMKKVLGFTLLLTSLWLVWLFGRIAGLEGVTGLLGFLIALSFGAWIYGEVQYRPIDRVKSFGLTAALVAVVVGGWLGIGGLDMSAAESSRISDAVAVETNDSDGISTIPTVNAEGTFNWQTWSHTTIDDALTDGRPVFVNFTADWCVSCKVNEREVLSKSEVIKAAQAANILMLKADLTHVDDELVEELERFGRSGVPLYLYYSPDKPDDPEVLPQVLTNNRILETFARRHSRR